LLLILSLIEDANEEIVLPSVHHDQLYLLSQLLAQLPFREPFQLESANPNLTGHFDRYGDHPANCEDFRDGKVWAEDFVMKKADVNPRIKVEEKWAVIDQQFNMLFDPPTTQGES